VTYPVVAQEEGYRPLLEFLQDGKCEIGTHLHPWVTPPYEEAINLQNSFPGNLPRALEREKIRILTDAIAQRFRTSPHVYRAGRYGIGPNTRDILRGLNYLVDTSVVPEQSYTFEHGPSFFGLPAKPYWMDSDQVLLEVPLTSAFVGLLGGSGGGLTRALYLDHHRHGLVRALLARARFLERIRLTPEGTNVHDAKRLVGSLLKRGAQTFMVSYHSPSLAVGNTPYVQSIEDRDRLLSWLDEFYSFFFLEIGGMPITATELYDIATKVKSASGTVAS
jgi:hypothetical protein